MAWSVCSASEKDTTYGLTSRVLQCIIALPDDRASPNCDSCLHMPERC